MAEPVSYTINVRGRLINLAQPQIMGILNCTPDSFYVGSRVQTEREIALRAHEIVTQGGDMIDIGAFSTRPGAAVVSEEEEIKRLAFALQIVRKEVPDAIVSVDTFRPEVARVCVEQMGADIINDVALGVHRTPTELQMYKANTAHQPDKQGHTTDNTPSLTERSETERTEMFRMMAHLQVPYILMSVKPSLETMMIAFARDVRELRALGVKDIMIDPGFGFGKTLGQNYEILAEMEKLHELDVPVLAGVSRKSMVFRLLGTDASRSLNGTTALHTIALLKGASILRVHDVKEAVEVRQIVGKLKENTPPYHIYNT